MTFKKIRAIFGLVVVFPILLVEAPYRELSRAWRNLSLLQTYKVYLCRYKQYWKEVLEE